MEVSYNKYKCNFVISVWKIKIAPHSGTSDFGCFVSSLPEDPPKVLGMASDAVCLRDFSILMRAAVFCSEWPGYLIFPKRHHSDFESTLYVFIFKLTKEYWRVSSVCFSPNKSWDIFLLTTDLLWEWDLHIVWCILDILFCLINPTQGKQNYNCMLASSVQFFCTRAPILLGQNSTAVKCTSSSSVGYTDDKEEGRSFVFQAHFYATEQNWENQGTQAAYSNPCFPLTWGRGSAFGPFLFGSPKSVSFCEEGKCSSWSWLPGLMLKNLFRLVS